MQNEQPITGRMNRYQVEVGHARVQVESHCQGDAVREARRRFCIDMPWLWDVIQAIDAAQFRVHLLR